MSQTSSSTGPLTTYEEATRKNSGSVVEGNGRPELLKSMKPPRHLEAGAGGHQGDPKIKQSEQKAEWSEAKS